MSRRAITTATELLDRARIEVNRYHGILELVLAEGPPRLTVNEKETLIDGLVDTRDVLQQAVEIIEKMKAKKDKAGS